MSFIDSLQFVGEDKRKRKYLLPESIAIFGGNVQDGDLLLEKKSMQIGLSEPQLTVLENGVKGKRAFVTLDFGAEIHGGLRLLISYCRGVDNPKVRLTFGESLSEAMGKVGTKGATNDHTIRQFTIPLTLLSDQVWGSIGFRFVKIELMSKNCKIGIKSALAEMVYRDLEYKGDFKCNDSLINKIYDTSVYTCHLCMQNLLWDGIKRDRLVWIGDMMIEAKVIHDVFGSVEIVEQSLEFTKDRTPVDRWMNNIPSYSMWWIVLLKDIYVCRKSRVSGASA